MLTSGRADVSIVFSTDGQIAADDLLVLEDDRKLFPPYNVSLIVNDKAAKAAGPDLPEDRRAGAAGPLHQGDAGAQLARRPRQGEARRRGPRLPRAVRLRDARRRLNARPLGAP